MDKLRGQSLKTDKIEIYPKNLIEQYLRASAKLKKVERVFFKRLAPNVADVKNDFYRLALKFEECCIFQYAAMCHIGHAKCEQFAGSLQEESNAYLRAARNFMQAHIEHTKLQLSSVRDEFRQGALHCYQHALERAVDGSVIKAAIIREMCNLTEYTDSTSSFASPTHRIHDLELAAETSIRREDFITALRQLDDIVDNIYERKTQELYGELLRSVEILRLLLLVQLNLPPSRQSPAHIKLIEHYYQLASFETDDYAQCNAMEDKHYIGFDKQFNPMTNGNSAPGAFITLQQQYALGEIILAWSERRTSDLKYLLKDFAAEFTSISNNERHLLKHIYAELCRGYH